MFKKTIIDFAIVLAGLNLMSCIHNDIPYPYIEGVIQDIAVYDMQGDAQIDTKRRIVELTVGEDAWLNSLQITKLVANAEASIFPDTSACIRPDQFPNYSFTSLSELPANANTSADFTTPLKITLSTYQDYVWTIKVTQNIERTVEIEHQIGNAQIDEQNKLFCQPACWRCALHRCPMGLRTQPRRKRDDFPGGRNTTGIAVMSWTSSKSFSSR